MNRLAFLSFLLLAISLSSFSFTPTLVSSPSPNPCPQPMGLLSNEISFSGVLPRGVDVVTPTATPPIIVAGDAIEYTNPDGSKTRSIFSSDQWVFDEKTQSWLNFTQAIPATSNDSGLYLDFPTYDSSKSDNVYSEVKVTLPNAVLLNNGKSWKFGFQQQVFKTSKTEGSFSFTVENLQKISLFKDGTFWGDGVFWDFSDMLVNQITDAKTGDYFNSTSISTVQLDESTVQVTVNYISSIDQIIVFDPNLSISVSDNVFISLGSTSFTPYFKFKLTSIPAGTTIQSATLWLYNPSNGAFPANQMGYAYNITTDWNEASTAAAIDALSASNTTNYTLINTANTPQWYDWLITGAVSDAYSRSKNITIRLNTSNECSGSPNSNTGNLINFGNCGSANFVDFDGRTAASNTPVLNVTYGGGILNWQNTNTTNGTAWTPNDLTTRIMANFTDVSNISSVVLTLLNKNITMAIWNGTVNTSLTMNANITNTSQFGSKSFDYFFTSYDGTYTVQSQNYTFFQDKAQLNLTLQLNGTNGAVTYTYPQTVNATGWQTNATALNPVLTLIRAGSNIAAGSVPTSVNTSLRVLAYNFSVFYAGNANWSSQIQSWTATINRGTPAVNLYLNNSVIRKAYYQDLDTVNASSNVNNTQGNLTLYRNTTAKAFGTQLAEEANQTSSTVQTYNYTACYPLTQNYSSLCLTAMANFGGFNVSFIAPTPANAFSSTTTNLSMSLAVSANSSFNNLSVYLQDLNNTLLDYWSFDDFNTTNVYTNFSTFADNLSFASGVNSVSNLSVSQRGIGMTLSGNSGDYLNSTLSSNITGLYNNFSLTGWFNFSNWGGSGFDVLFGKTDDANSAFQLTINRSSKKLIWQVTNNWNNYSVASATTLKNNTFYHFAVLWDSTNGATMYVNGTNQTGSDGLQAYPFASGNFVVGAMSNGSEPFNGTLDEIMVYNKSLSLQEINASFDASKYPLKETLSNVPYGTSTYTAIGIDFGGLSNTTSRSITFIQNLAPQFIWQAFNVTNSSSFNGIKTVRFFSNWSDDNGTSSVIMTFNNTNYTMAIWNGTSNTSITLNANITGLPVGNYFYNFTGYDGALANTSQTFELSIIQNTTWSLLHTLNGSASNLVGAYPDTVSVSCTQNSADSLTLNELRNGTTVATGSSISYSETPRVSDYNFSCSSAGDVNYSSQTSQLFMNVSKGTLNLTEHLNGTNANVSITYPQTFNITGWATNASSFTPTLTIFDNTTGIAAGSVPTSVNVSRGVGTYNFSLFFAGNENYTSNIQTWNGTVNLGSVNITTQLNGTNNNKQYSFGDTINASTWLNTSGLSLTLQKNGSGIAFGTNPESKNLSLSAGQSYNFTGCFAGNANYSSACSGFLATIAINSLNLTEQLNGTNNNKGYSYGDTINVTGWSNVSSLSLTLYKNSTAIADTSIPSSLNLSLSANQSYNFSTCFSGNENYTGGCQSWLATIAQNTLNLTLQLNGSNNNATYTYPQTINATAWSNASLVIRLLENGTIIANATVPASVNISRAGSQTYNFSAYWQGNENYTPSIQTFFATVNQGNVNITEQLNGTNNNKSYSYGDTVNASAWMNTTPFGLTMYENGTAIADTSTPESKNLSLSAGQSYNFSTCFGGNENYSGLCQSWLATIASNTLILTLQLNGSSSDMPYIYPQTVNASGYSNVSGLALTLLRNGTAIADTSTPTSVNTSLAVADYNFSLYWAGNANYSSSIKTFFANFTKGNVTLIFQLNGSNGDASYSSGDTVNASSSVNNSEGNLTIYRDGTAVAFGVNTAEESNFTSLVSQTYNYTACYPNSINYSGVCSSHFATFTASTSGAPHPGGGEPSSNNPCIPIFTIDLPQEHSVTFNQSFDFTAKISVNAQADDCVYEQVKVNLASNCSRLSYYPSDLVDGNATLKIGRVYDVYLSSSAEASCANQVSVFYVNQTFVSSTMSVIVAEQAPLISSIDFSGYSVLLGLFLLLLSIICVFLLFYASAKGHLVMFYLGLIGVLTLPVLSFLLLFDGVELITIKTSLETKIAWLFIGLILAIPSIIFYRKYKLKGLWNETMPKIMLFVTLVWLLAGLILLFL